MAVKSSGPLSFATDIVGEFADSAPHAVRTQASLHQVKLILIVSMIQ